VKLNSKETMKGENAVKFCKLIVLTTAVLMLAGTQARSEITDKIIAVVNGEIITQNEFNAAFEPYLKRIDETYPGSDKEAIIRQTKAALLQRFIDDLLIEQEAKKAGTSIKEEEVMEVLRDSLARQNIRMEDFLKKTESEGRSLETVKNEVRGQMMRTRLMRREIKSKVMISDQEIGEYYNRHRDEYEGKEAVRIKQILLLIPKNADEETKAGIRNEAQQILNRAASGEPFDLLAMKYSQGPEAQQGGDIGFIEKGVIIPEVEKAAFSLPLEQISNVIESSLGFHIIKVIDKRGAGLKKIESVREEIKTKLEDEKLEKKYDEWISAVRKKSFIEKR
jgi:parvulin-like peptidyl-prolyl isomerase